MGLLSSDPHKEVSGAPPVLYPLDLKQTKNQYRNASQLCLELSRLNHFSLSAVTLLVRVYILTCSSVPEVLISVGIVSVFIRNR